jgi:hypothetical protein
MTWNPSEHSDQDNLTWSYLRAIEWGRWPIFLSQLVAPILLVFFNWVSVIVGVILLNILWSFLVRYRFVSVTVAYWGAVFARLKWLFCLGAAIYLFLNHRTISAILSLSWPMLIFILGMLPTTQIGIIQKMFMKALGYEPAMKPSSSSQPDGAV